MHELTPRPTLAVLGLTDVGIALALRLSEFFDVRGYDTHNRNLVEAVAAGITLAAEECTALEADFLVVASDEPGDLPALLLGPSGPRSAPCVPGGSVLLLAGTPGVGPARQVGRNLAGLVHVVDAPVTGGLSDVLQGRLRLLVGGNDAARRAARPVLDRLATDQVVVGSRPGDAQAMDAVERLARAAHLAVGAEALALALALELDPDRALVTLAGGPAGSAVIAQAGPRMLEAYEDDAEVRNPVETVAGDLRAAQEDARTCGVPTPVAAAAEQLYRLACAHGLGRADESVLLAFIAPPPHLPEEHRPALGLVR